jgi:Ca2+-binding RTX toxin-like protein
VQPDFKEASLGTFSFGSGLRSVDTTGLDLGEIIAAPIVTSTSTRLVLNPGAVFFRAEGSGFVYSRQGGQIVDVTAGTLDRFVVSSTETGGIIGFDWTNLNLSMATLADSLFGNNPAAFREYLFSRADRITGTAGADNLGSYEGNDTVFGARGNDSIIAGVGNDQLFGGVGADNLRGGSDTDVLFGGLGADELRGGGGRDGFVFNTAIGATQRDTITDFTAVDDVIKLDNAIFTAFTTLGTMVATRFQAGGSAQDAGDRIIYDRAEGVLSYDRDGTGSAVAVIFALVDPGTALGYQDIVII